MGDTLKYVLYTVAGGLVIWILYSVFGKKKPTKRRRRNSNRRRVSRNTNRRRVSNKSTSGRSRGPKLSKRVKAEAKLGTRKQYYNSLTTKQKQKYNLAKARLARK